MLEKMMVRSLDAATSAPTLRLVSFPSTSKQRRLELEVNSRTGIRMRVSAKDRGQNRKPLQRGRNLSTEAIQTVQALKRAYQKDSVSLDHVFRTKFSRLLKVDMIAVLRELLRQNQCLLALKGFEDIRKEEWYKPQLSLYVDTIATMASDGLCDKVELLRM